VAICAPIAPYAATRSVVRTMAEEAGDFVLIWVSTPLAHCEARDRKGLYARARAGGLPGFTGIDDPYEEPADADLAIDTSDRPVEECLRDVVAFLRRGGWLEGPS
jgi:sulfate adenylyltransferase